MPAIPTISAAVRRRPDVTVSRIEHILENSRLVFIDIPTLDALPDARL
jgi:hypothetical protein